MTKTYTWKIVGWPAAVLFFGGTILVTVAAVDVVRIVVDVVSTLGHLLGRVL